MTIRRSFLLSMGLVAAAAAVGLWAWTRLPPGAVIAVHFDVRGVANGFASKGPVLAILPVVGACVIALLAALPSVALSRKGLASASGAYGTTMVGIAAIFLVSQGAIVARALDPAFDVLTWVSVAVGVLLAVIGNLLGKVRHNFLFGVRTPWTLANERVWDKTHRFTGRLMVLAGVVLAVGAGFALRGGSVVALLVLCAAAPPLAGAVYSWRLYRNLAHPTAEGTAS